MLRLLPHKFISLINILNVSVIIVPVLHILKSYVSNVTQMNSKKPLGSVWIAACLCVIDVGLNI